MFSITKRILKKKIYKYLSVTVIVVAMVVSFQVSRANNATDLTMENVEALAMADGEGYLGKPCMYAYGTCVWDDGFSKKGQFVY